MDPNFITLAERLGVPTFFLLAVLYGAWRLARDAGSFMGPLLVRFVEAVEANSRAIVGANEKLQNVGTTLDWHHDTMVAAGHGFDTAMTRVVAASERAAHEASTARQVSERVLDALKAS